MSYVSELISRILMHVPPSEVAISCTERNPNASPFRETANPSRTNILELQEKAAENVKLSLENALKREIEGLPNPTQSLTVTTERLTKAVKSPLVVTLMVKNKDGMIFLTHVAYHLPNLNIEGTNVLTFGQMRFPLVP